MKCRSLVLIAVVAAVTACTKQQAEAPTETKKAEEPLYKVDAATAGTVSGRIAFKGRKPAPKKIDMDQDAACAKLHKGGGRSDEDLVVNKDGTLANVFVYVKTGLEGKRFEVPSAPVKLDQNGCWFQPRVLGIQTGQTLSVTNSDPVTHNVHPMAQVNREWNQSQGGGDPPLTRRFTEPEIMVPVKCNIHRWMRAWIGVLNHPYFAVTGSDGSFEIRNLPPGEYTVAAWQESLGAQEQSVKVGPSGRTSADFIFKGE
jgi:plastocyanin